MMYLLIWMKGISDLTMWTSFICCSIRIHSAVGHVLCWFPGRDFSLPVFLLVYRRKHFSFYNWNAFFLISGQRNDLKTRYHRSFPVNIIMVIRNIQVHYRRLDEIFHRHQKFFQKFTAFLKENAFCAMLVYKDGTLKNELFLQEEGILT